VGSANIDSAVIALLVDTGRLFYARNWVLGTSGNFSAVVGRDPWQLLITASGAHKGELTQDDFVVVNESGEVVDGTGRPSAETNVHLTIVRLRGARSVLHTHSVWATILSEAFAPEGGITISGYEMLKGLSGVSTHDHHEWLPVCDNTQNYAALSANIEEMLRLHPQIHGILLRSHGLYTWGKDIAEARRHIEIFEFLFEVMGRKYSARPKQMEN
jgi:methylthioribulose-1-phosphate dehydratase